MKINEVIAPDYWRRIARFWMPRTEPLGHAIAARFESMLRSGRAQNIEDDVAESAAITTELAQEWEKALDKKFFPVFLG